MEFFVILTLAALTETGMRQITISKSITVKPGQTRAGLCAWMLKQAPECMQDGANVVFFSAEPNVLLPAVTG